MTGRRTEQLDLLAWEPDRPVRRYDDERVRAASLRAKIARAVSETLKDSDLDRADIARRMGEWLGEEFSLHMLNAYASEAREDHTIPFLKLLALIHATGDVRPLQVAAELFGHSVVDDRYLPWIEVGQLSEVGEEISKKREAALRSARRGARR